MKFLTIFGLTFLSLNFAKASPQTDALLKAAQDIPKFFAVENDKIYRGARPQPQDLRTLKLAGIKTIVDLQGGDFRRLGRAVGIAEPGELDFVINQEKKTSENLGLNWVSKPLSTFEVNRAEDRYIQETLHIMNDPKMQPVFIHCEFGKDRTGLLAALYEVLFLGESVATAHQRWVASGHNGKLDRTTSFMLDVYFYKFLLEL